MDGHETPYVREHGYAERYRDLRFDIGSGRGTHRRESRALARLIQRAGVTSGPWLDVPCGAGRLSALIPTPVFLVDRDLEMVRACPRDTARICASVHDLPFADGSFAGAICLRLLHHIPGSPERRKILDELRRVCRGPVIVSFFHSFSLQHLRRKIARRLGKRVSGRCALSWRRFRRDLEAVGFRVVATRPLARGVSEQWLVLVSPVAEST